MNYLKLAGNGSFIIGGTIKQEIINSFTGDEDVYFEFTYLYLHLAVHTFYYFIILYFWQTLQTQPNKEISKDKHV